MAVGLVLVDVAAVGLFRVAQHCHVSEEMPSSLVVRHPARESHFGGLTWQVDWCLLDSLGAAGVHISILHIGGGESCPYRKVLFSKL